MGFLKFIPNNSILVSNDSINRITDPIKKKKNQIIESKILKTKFKYSSMLNSQCT